MGFRIEKATRIPRKMRPHWLRFWRDLKGLPKNRFHTMDEIDSETRVLTRKGYYPREDISHAYVNLFVEFWRETAYLGGHIVALIPIGYAIYCVMRWLA